jgi:hypothetical protein
MLVGYVDRVGYVDASPRRLRIRRTGHKVLVILAFSIVFVLAVVAGRSMELPEYVIDEVSALLVVTVVYVGARTFRGEGEEIAASRVWWRMSARPTASFVLAAYFLLRSVSSVWVLYQVLVSGWMDFTYLLLCAADPVIAGLYVNSGVRIVRARDAAPSSARAF